MNKILSVSQLNNYIKNVFDDELLLQNITVEGEVSEAKFSGGNTYITLKEGDYVLSCVKFGARYEFAIGDKIRATGSMRFYPRGGKATFVMTYANGVGKGELLIKLNDLKERLAKEGVFDNTKTLPRFIKNIALVTSAEGAVIHDFLEVLSRNNCSYIDIDVYSVKVQGAEAPQSIVKAVSLSEGKKYDVMVVARGGGSEQDLGCFNTEAVARCVSSCPFPVISAIGHEVNFTLCDFASSLRAGTPSIAAEYIVRNNEAFLSCFYTALSDLSVRAERLFGTRLENAKSRMYELLQGCESKAAEVKARISGVLGDIYGYCRDDSLRFGSEFKRLLNIMQVKADNILAAKEHELRLSSAVLDKSSPLKILSDGYAKVIKNEQSVNNVNEVKIGDDIKVVMSGGALYATVNGKE